MNSSEWRATGSLSLLYLLRMLGIFMVLPILALYVSNLPGHITTIQIGLAIGIYGLFQAFLQIPLGMLSDRIGRKPIIVAGILVFAAGSIVAGATENIHWVILGRALQGAGAISSAAQALLADVTRPESRTKAMTLLGVGMGAAFLLALIFGPILSGWIGVNGIFVVSGVLTLFAIPVFLIGMPNAPRLPVRPGGFRNALRDGQLLRLDGGIFCMHTMMTAVFVAAPFAIQKTYGLDAPEQWEFYLPVLIASILPVFPFIGWAEKNHRMKEGLIGSVILLGVALLIAADGHGQRLWLALAMWLFFVGLNFLEGALPSLISRRAPEDQKGAALGVYSTSQFFGAFAGSAIGGVALGVFGIGGVFGCAAVLALIWLSFAFTTIPAYRHSAPAQQPESGTN